MKVIRRFNNLQQDCNDFDKENQKQQEKKMHSLEISSVNTVYTLQQAMNIEFEDYQIKELNYQENCIAIDRCLKKHRISCEHRAKMIDWMIDVFKAFNSFSSTFFISVKLLDFYFYKEEMCIEVNQLHLIGVACMLIASKFNDIKPMKISTVQQRITRGKFTHCQINSMERKILSTIEYKINIPTVKDFIDYWFRDENMPEIVKQIAIIAAHISQLSYELSQAKPSLLAQAMICFAYEQCNINYTYQNDDSTAMLLQFKFFLQSIEFIHTQLSAFNGLNISFLTQKIFQFTDQLKEQELLQIRLNN